MNTPDIEEINIQDIIGGYYEFFQSLSELREVVECSPDIGNVSRSNLSRLLDQVEVHCRDSHEWILTRDVNEIRMGIVGTQDSCKSTLIAAFHEGVVEMGDDDPYGRYKMKIMVGSKPCLLLIREETNLVSRHLSQWADILMLVYSYSNLSSLHHLVDVYNMFKVLRCDIPEASVLLVGVVDDFQSKVVAEVDVRKVADVIDNCRVFNTTLSQPSAVNNVFIHACRQYLLTIYPQSNTTNYSPSLPMSPSSTTPALGGIGNHSNRIIGDHGSPIIGKKNLRRKPLKHGSQKAVGTGRIIPVKEGQVYKKSAGMRSDWKKKYLVLTENELTYYPNITDYMNQVHGKTLSLQHITVKVPGQYMPIVKSSSVPPHAPMDQLSLMAGQSDRSGSISPTHLEGSLKINGDVTNTSVTVTPSSPKIQGSRELRSPLSEGDSTDELSKSDKYPFSHNMISHTRNISMDEITLQQLKSTGAAFPSAISTDEREQRDRAFTLSRIQKKNRKMMGTLLSPISHSDEDLSEMRSGTGSHDSLKSEPKKTKKKGDKDRNSLVLVDRVSSDSMPIREDSKKDKVTSKHRRQRSLGLLKTLDVMMDGSDVHVQDTTEFHIHSLEGKVWSFDAGCADEMADWVKAIESQIKKYLEESLLPKRNPAFNEEAKIKILAMTGNDLCADCGSPNPEWASLNHGCMVCIECSGVHRNFGSHISRIRSLHLDQWRPELVSVMTAIGNEISWKIFENRLPRNKPNPNSSVEDRERYIRAKYIEKEFIADLSTSNLSLAMRILESVKTDDSIGCLHLLAHATPADVNHQHSIHNGGSALHVACNLGRIVIVQLLVWNYADVDMLDHTRRSPLFYARIAGHEDCAQILIQNNCNEDIGLHSPLSSEYGSTEVLQPSDSLRPLFT